MSIETFTITVGEAEDIVWGNDKSVTMEFMNERRWTIDYLVVYKELDQLFGFYYFAPATEDQEGMDDLDKYEIQDGEVTVYRVQAVPSVTYEVMT
jgi:hypothetical protein